MICILTHRQVANSYLSSRGSGRAPKESKGMSWAFGVCTRVQVGIYCSHNLYQHSKLQKDLPKNLWINWTINSQSKVFVFLYWICCIFVWHISASVLLLQKTADISVHPFLHMAFLKCSFQGSELWSEFSAWLCSFFFFLKYLTSHLVNILARLTSTFFSFVVEYQFDPCESSGYDWSKCMVLDNMCTTAVSRCHGQ